MSDDFESFSWIRTRDGSPTLFHNDEGAAFRSQKGAFTESYHVFVRPALDFASAHSSCSLRLLEFGLGPGTNWLLWSLLSPHTSEYYAIEKDLRSFELGIERWLHSAASLREMINKSTNIPFDETAPLFKNLHAKSASPENLVSLNAKNLAEHIQQSRKRLKVFASLEECHQHFCSSSSPHPFDLCFFDPFGYDVNPEAYQAPSLEKIHDVLTPQGRAFSYACNSKFQRSLKAARFDLDTPFSGSAQLKRERIEFWPKDD